MTHPNSHPLHDLATVLEAVEKGITITGAAKTLGVTRRTMHKYVKRWKEVERTVHDKRNELVDLGEMGLRSAVLRGEPWACAFALRTLGKDRGYTERHEVTGPDGERLTVNLRWDDGNGNT